MTWSHTEFQLGGIVSGLDRWLPRSMTILGAVHLVYGVVESPGVIRDMLADGLVSTADNAERGYVVWFMVSGVALLAVAWMARWAARTVGRMPAALGWWLVVIGALIVITEPVSGGWLVMLLGALTVVAARRAIRAVPQPANV
nr:DUF6463 family protein [Kribbella sp. VKM Ac-2527]